MEVALSVVGPRGGLGMVLHGEDRVLPVLHALDGVVVQVKVRDLERFGSRDPRRVAPDREAVVLRGYKYLTCSEIANWVVASPVTVGQFDRVPAQGEAEQLMPEADPKDREGAVGKLAQRRNRISHRRRIARAVRQK